MRFFRFVFIISVLVVISTLIYRSESKHDEHQCHDQKLQTKRKRAVQDEAIDKMHMKLPRVILRKFEEWSIAPGNFSSLYHSIPMEMTHVKDDMFYLIAPYRKTTSTILNVRLWMEFPNISKSSILQSKEYLLDIMPMVGSRDADGYNDCSTMTFISKARFPEDILEMKFDITTMYMSCSAKDDSSHFKLKFRFYPHSDLVTDSDIDLNKDEVHMFLLFKEHDEIEDIMHLLPNSVEIEPLHYEGVMKKFNAPQKFPSRNMLKSFTPRRKGTKVCALRPFTFNFDDSGWKSYVLAPKEYKSNKCTGRCTFPIPDHLNSTNYAIMKAIASTIYKSMKSPNCIAQNLAPLTMLVCDEDLKFTLKSQKDMIATSCQCA